MTAPFTAGDIVALRPCWLNEPGGEGRIRLICGDGITAERIATLADVSLADRRWVLCHLLTRGPRPDRPALVRWSCGIALRVVDRIADEESHAAARECIEVAIRWSVGDATQEQVWAARSRLLDHWPAAYAAAAAAAYAAADAAYAAYAGDLIDLAAIIDAEVRP